MSWKPYLNNRLIKDKGTYYVIKPDDATPPVPLSCDICETLYRDRADEQSHIEYGCCSKCAMKWAHANKDKWKSGWRPAPDEVKTELFNRPGITVRVDVD
jgi:hypothetical protein